VKQIRKRLTYANVMSSLAVFLILGGATAVAAKKIGSNEIKGNSITTGKLKKEAVTRAKVKKAAIDSSKLADNAVTTSKIADDAVTGAKVKESTLGEVPSAAKAVNAVNAENAATVGGQTVLKIFGLVPSGAVGQQTIASFSGFTITSNCAGTDPDINLLSPAGVAFDMKAQGNGTGAGTVGPFASGTQGAGGGTLTLDRDGTNNNDRGASSFSAALINGTVVSGEIGFDDANSFAAEPACAIYGQVTIG
jgi:hypothetical protein